ncbi:MAG: hypothetical protein IMW98_01825 [Firmicutes bacterium]|nr:hypothetical protein [Bacillota bacterium]
MPAGHAPRVHAVIFEGGRAAGPWTAAMARAREAVTLLRVRLLRAAGAEAVYVVSDRPALLEAARAAGAEALPSVRPFRFGRELARAARRAAAAGPGTWLLYFGGGAAATLDLDGLRELIAHLREPDVAWLNNPQSPDVFAAPAAALAGARGAWPSRDNAAGEFLARAGLRRALWPNRAALNLDLDTPADAYVLRWLAERGLAPGPVSADADLRRALAAVPAAGGMGARLEAVARVLQEGGELALLGRVAPTTVLRLNERWKCRVRVFSEERGMKALGREAAGAVRSLVAEFVARAGPEAFFAALARVADAALFDTRVLLAAWGCRAGEEERFAADAGDLDRVTDPPLARFAAAAHGAPLPVLLGGHTLVNGALWTLSDALAQAAPNSR